jgi:hypothetical protein
LRNVFSIFRIEALKDFDLATFTFECVILNWPSDFSNSPCDCNMSVCDVHCTDKFDWLQMFAIFTVLLVNLQISVPLNKAVIEHKDPTSEFGLVSIGFTLYHIDRKTQKRTM